MRALSFALDRLTPDTRLFLAGSAGEPTALLSALAREPERSRGLDIVTSAVPGINRFDWALLDPSAIVSGLFVSPRLRAMADSGRYRHLPATYAGFVQDVRSARRSFDVAVVQVAPPDAAGRCSMGPAVEFMPAVLANARATIAVVNEDMPALPGAPTLECRSFDLMVEGTAPLPTYDVGGPDPVANGIASLIAPLLEDGATLQAGLGKVPTLLMHQLVDRRGLRLHSGMFGEGVRTLAEAGALDRSAPHRACVMVGPDQLYRWAMDHPELELVGCDVTHDPAVLAGLDRLVAINSAIEVDLNGQCALEHAGGVAVSGAGGAPDFARAARLAVHGLSIVALPATAADGAISRIVARLSSPGVATLSRHDVDLVVTEHGVADLRGLDVEARARALISVAHPTFRRPLTDNWAARRREGR